jgi:hypothetical protein
MRTRSSWATLAAISGALVIASASYAQTTQTGNGSSSANGTNSSAQAQSDPVGQTHSDGQSGKSRRPDGPGVDVPQDLDRAAQ